MQRVCLVLLAIAAIAIAKPPGPSPWASYAAGKPVYARSLGPPATSGIGSITVPYKPKSSPFFPKFVDPTMMISKKTDMLSNLFGGLGPVNYPAGPMNYPSYFGAAGASTPVLYADEPINKDTSDLEEIFGKAPVSQTKRGIFGPVGPKFGPMGPKFPAGSSPFAPFAPFGAKFGAFDGSDAASMSEITGNSVASRRKRSITDVTPPPYPGLGPIPEEPEPEVSTAPKQYLPGMFGPFGPYGPVPFAASPVVDPGMFISKKTSFLDSLFKNLATSTAAPVESPTEFPTPKPTIVPADFWSSFDTATETAAPTTEKSTIVPPGYWTPSGIVPGPMEYTNKVSDFLDKLFDSLKLNKTSTTPKSKFTRSLTSETDIPTTKVARSIDDLATISAAKDTIVDSIIDELGSLKTDMFNTMNDFIAAQTPAAVPVSPFPPKPVKPGKVGKPVKPTSPFKAAFASMWTPPPPVDTTLPFKQKMTVLSGVFDMLTGLQKNITLALQDSISKASSTDAPSVSDDDLALASGQDVAAQLNATLLDAIKSKLDSLAAPAPVNPYLVGKYARSLPGKSGTSAWGGYSQGETAKREINGDDDDDDDDEVYESQRHQNNHEQFKRGVKMTMHQGYQSMPPGTVETVQAGGGSVPGHQGGGIKLFNEQQDPFDNYGEKWAAWAESMKGQNEARRNHHHHNHH